jgi:hypothetical protein
MKISCRIPEIYKLIHSYCSKCFGLLVSTQIVVIIQQYLIMKSRTILPHKVQLYCDCKSAVEWINKMKNISISLKNQLAPNMDLVKGFIDGINIIKLNFYKVCTRTPRP